MFRVSEKHAHRVRKLGELLTYAAIVGLIVLSVAVFGTLAYVSQGGAIPWP